MNIKQDNFFPQMQYYDPDFISIYEQSWSRIDMLWVPPTSNLDVLSGYIDHEEVEALSLLHAISSSFFLLYSNNHLSATHLLDVFYNFQQASGQIPSFIDKPIVDTPKKGPLQSLPSLPSLSQLSNLVWKHTERVVPPLLLWAEYNYFNRSENKKRLKEILPKLDKYLEWFVNSFQQENKLFVIPKNAHYLDTTAPKQIHYFLDFNAQMALAFSCMSQLANFATVKTLALKYSKCFYQLKALINKHFWHAKDDFYYDLDERLQPVKRKTISAFWTLLATIPNNQQASALKSYLENPKIFNTQCPFPSLSADDPAFSEFGLGYKGTVYPLLTYMTIKGLVTYGYHEFARESALKHLSSILTVFFSENPELSETLWESYQPNNFSPAKPLAKNEKIHKNFFPSIGLSTIALNIEVILGIEIYMHKKMLYWTIPNLEFMGIDSLQLKRNLIAIKLQNSTRGWEIRNGSEKLFYFSVNILEKEIKKTLPIPSGKCSLLIDKI